MECLIYSKPKLFIFLLASGQLAAGSSAAIRDFVEGKSNEQQRDFLDAPQNDAAV